MQDNFNVILGILPFVLYVRVLLHAKYYALNVHLNLICVLCDLTMSLYFKCLFNVFNRSFSLFIKELYSTSCACFN